VKLNPLPRNFYARFSVEVAKDLLGRFLVRELQGKLLVGRIVEVEAYGGPEDPASHARFGKKSWNEVMFGEVGRAYIYQIYGIHHCLNVVAKPENVEAGAVLIRAVEPIIGIETMIRNRFQSGNWNGKLRNLTSGPAKLCKAFKINLSLNGEDLTVRGPLYIAGNTKEPFEIINSPRIGIKRGLYKKWRFYIKNSEYISGGRIKTNKLKTTSRA